MANVLKDILASMPRYLVHDLINKYVGLLNIYIVDKMINVSLFFFRKSNLRSYPLDNKIGCENL